MANYGVIVSDMHGSFLFDATGRPKLDPVEFTRQKEGIEKLLAFSSTQGVYVVFTHMVHFGSVPRDFLFSHEPYDTFSKGFNDDPFQNSPWERVQLEDRLRQRNVDTVVIAGVNASACVRTTAESAMQRGFQVVVPEEQIADGPRLRVYNKSLDFYRRRTQLLPSYRELIKQMQTS